MYEDLSSKQLQVLNFIKTQVYKRGYPPSVREICKGVNLKSTASVHGHLKRLEKKGYIKKDPTKPRAIEVIDKNYLNFNEEVVHIPFIREIAVGQPILTIENIEDTIPVPKTLVDNENNFILKVKNNNIVDDIGICDGDFVLVKQQNNAVNRDIVVVLLDGKATIKRFFKEKDHIGLQSKNQSTSYIYTKNVKILGKVIGLFRRF